MAELNLSAASQLFDTEVTQIYQNTQRLQGTVTERHGTVGVATNVPVSGIIDFSQKSFAPGNLQITPYANTNVMIVPYDYALKTVIGGGEKTLFNFDRITDEAKSHANAAGRMSDFIKINSIFADPNIGQIPVIPVTVGPDTGLNVAKMIAGRASLEATGVNMSDHISLWTPAALKAELLNDDKAVSYFYNNDRPLMNGQFSSYLGIDIRTLGNNGINQIPYTTNTGVNTYLVPMVAEDAIVQIWNRPVSTNIVWVPQEDRWELVSVFTSGAKIIQYKGIVLLTARDPSAANP